MKVVTDKGEGDKYKKNSRDLIIFFSKKARTLLFLYTPYVVVTEEGRCLFVRKVVPENTGHPMQQKGKLFVNNSVPAFCKYLRVIYTDNLHSAEKYARKFIHGHHLFLEAHSFLRVSLSENFAFWNR